MRAADEDLVPGAEGGLAQLWGSQGASWGGASGKQLRAVPVNLCTRPPTGHSVCHTRAPAPPR